MADETECDDVDSSPNNVCSLSVVKKYSYATLTACLLAALFEDQREWNENRVKALIHHLKLPKRVLPSVLAHLNDDQMNDDQINQNQNSKMQISICEGGDTFSPLIKTLKEESTTEDSMMIIIKDLIENDLRNGIYDARSRVLVHSLGVYLGIVREKIDELENQIAQDLQDTDEESSGNSEESVKNRKSRRRKRRLLLIGVGAVGGGALAALTGGIAAPFVAAGVAGLIAGGSGAFFGTATGLALITSIFGAAGAGLTAYRVKRRVGHLEEFNFKRLTNGKSLDLTIAVTGWLVEDENDFCSFRRPWESLDKSKEQYFLKWESKYLKELGSAITDFLRDSTVSYVTQQALMYTVLNGLVSAVVWPFTLLKVGYLIDNPWSVCKQRADEAGRELANLLATRQQGKRPVSLIGFSFGARVIFSCLKELVNKKDCEGLIEDVIVLGTPVSGKWTEWKPFQKIVAGRIINGYCRKDWLLQFVYRTTSVRSTVAGLHPISWPNRRMVNVDLSEIVDGHLDYASPDKIKSVLDFIGIKTRPIDPCTQKPPESKDVTKDELVHVEASEIVRLILEERLDVALEVVAIKQTATVDDHSNNASNGLVNDSVNRTASNDN